MHQGGIQQYMVGLKSGKYKFPHYDDWSERLKDFNEEMKTFEDLKGKLGTKQKLTKQQSNEFKQLKNKMYKPTKYFVANQKWQQHATSISNDIKEQKLAQEILEQQEEEINNQQFDSSLNVDNLSSRNRASAQAPTPPTQNNDNQDLNL